eukprot:TRINITY_DN9057_c0_g1_i3.p1 TRINITY_DN9057_c0_g1~~TRINITY_DN9057_c0_g1_i3.p1  ORF type:complete len:133 (+),score=28.99 TRINITY_DN9057_c0_g1_i3:26-400(+)
MIRRPPRSTHCISSAASDVYKRQPLSFKVSFPKVFKRRNSSTLFKQANQPNKIYKHKQKPSAAIDHQNIANKLTEIEALINSAANNYKRSSSSLSTPRSQIYSVLSASIDEAKLNTNMNASRKL